MAVRSQHIQVRVTPAEKTALERLARRAGLNLSSYLLSKALPQEQAQFDRVLRTLHSEEHGRHALAELNDLLTELTPMQFAPAVQSANLGGLTPFLQNYVAAMVEEAAHQKGVAPPAWTRDVIPLDTPTFSSSLRRLRPYLLRVAPVPFKRRNIFVDASVGARV